MRPLRDYLLIERKAAAKVSEGGVALPDTAEEKPSEGIVIAKGSKVSDEIAVGDRVRISSFAGTEVQDGATTYLLAQEKDVLLILGTAV